MSKAERKARLAAVNSIAHFYRESQISAAVFWDEAQTLTAYILTGEIPQAFMSEAEKKLRKDWYDKDS